MDAALVAARFVHFAATMTLFGATFYAAALAPPSPIADLAALLRRLAPTFALLSLASAAAWLVFVARDMADGELDYDTVSEVFWGTAFGRVWQARLVILILLTIATLRPDRRWRAPALVSGLAVASLGLVGHAAMQTGALGLAHRLNHAAHLLLTSYWLGGLPPFLVCLRSFTCGRRDTLGAMMRFSRIGHFAVPGILLTGAVDVAMTTGALPWPPHSPYRVGLLVKILVFLVMTAVALGNRYILAPRLAGSALAARALAAGAYVEIALALTAISLVSAFARFDPA